MTEHHDSTVEPHDAYERWLQGGRLDGVHFAHGSRVVLLEGDEAGAAGEVVSLQGLAPEPLYVVALDSGSADVAALQSGLRPDS